MRRVLYRCVFWLLILAVALIGARWGIDRAYHAAVAEAEPFASGCHRLWAHRGQMHGEPPNSIAGVKAALAAGFRGVEVDLHYWPQRDLFLLAHDWPARPGDTLTLNGLLDAIDPAVLLWLDAKNLGELWPWQADRAVARLRSVLDDHGSRQRAIVESRNPLYLRWVKAADIPTSLLVSPNAEHAAPAYWANVYIQKWLYSWGPFTALSMGWERYDAPVRDAFGERVPIHLSTLSDPTDIRPLLAIDNVRVMLTNRPLAGLAGCGQ